MTELQELKRLLVGEETDAVKKLASRLDRLEDREHRLQNVVESLPEAILASDDRLSQALGKPVRDSFRDSLARDPQQYAEILYPVMAPSIRMSIAQAMRDVVRSINQTVDSAFSMQSLKWRLESIRTRTPYSRIVLQNSFRYRVEEILLIHKVTGLLIDRVVVDPDGGQDGDAVGAMLAALEDFVRDSFSNESDVDNNDLREVDVGGRTVWLSHSPTITMATVIFGHPPEALRRKLDAQLELLHAEYGPALRDFDGSDPISGLQHELDESLDSFAVVEPNEIENEVRRPNPFASVFKVVLGVALLSALIFYLFRSIEQSHTLSSTHRVLDETPGVVVTDISMQDGQIHVTGLRDPLAEIDDEQLRRIGVPIEKLDMEMEPYQSLDGYVVRQRAQKQMEIPESVEVWLSDSILKLSGEADYPWLLRALERSNHVAGITGVNFDGIIPRARSVQQYLAAASNAPDSVRFLYVAGVVRAEGIAPLAWINDVDSMVFNDRWIRRVDWSNVIPLERNDLQRAARELDAQRLVVKPGDNGVLSIEDLLINSSAVFKEILLKCEMLAQGCVLNVFVTSAVSDPAANRTAVQQIDRIFRTQGVEAKAISVQSGDFYEVDPSKAEMVISFSVEQDAN